MNAIIVFSVKQRIIPQVMASSQLYPNCYTVHNSDYNYFIVPLYSLLCTYFIIYECKITAVLYILTLKSTIIKVFNFVTFLKLKICMKSSDNHINGGGIFLITCYAMVVIVFPPSAHYKDLFQYDVTPLHSVKSVTLRYT